MIDKVLVKLDFFCLTYTKLMFQQSYQYIFRPTTGSERFVENGPQVAFLKLFLLIFKSGGCHISHSFSDVF